MEITKEQLKGKIKEVGELDGDPVIEGETKGGLHFVMVSKKGKTETLGMANHRAIARYMAEKRNPDVKFTSLAKSEDLPRWVIEKDPRLPEFVQLTDRVRALE